MSVIRTDAIEQAKLNGICTQCLKNEAMPHRFQCERCIATNKRKNERRRKMKMCKCGQPAVEGKRSCAKCLEKNRVYWRRKKAEQLARVKAFGKKDTGEKRKYTKRVPLSPVQMQGMINELELFIRNLPHMKASEYLEARENVIKNILLRGK